MFCPNLIKLMILLPFWPKYNTYASYNHGGNISYSIFNHGGYIAAIIYIL